MFLDGLHFVTVTVVDWVDIFTRPRYKRIIVDSLSYCQQQKGLKIYAWVLMTNHLHLIVSAGSGQDIGEIIRDFKKHTSKKILAELEIDQQESRREWMLNRFKYAAMVDNKITYYRFWQDGYHAETIRSLDFYRQKLNYIHHNPVKQELVSRPEDYPYSSAIDYAGGKGILDVEIVVW